MECVEKSTTNGLSHLYLTVQATDEIISSTNWEAGLFVILEELEIDFKMQ